MLPLEKHLTWSAVSGRQLTARSVASPSAPAIRVSRPRGTKRYTHTEDGSDSRAVHTDIPKRQGGAQAGARAERNKITRLKSCGGVSTSVRNGSWLARWKCLHLNTGENRLLVLSSGRLQRVAGLGVQGQSCWHVQEVCKRITSALSHSSSVRTAYVVPGWWHGCFPRSP